MKRTYQCFFHKRDRANRTLYKTENKRKLPSRLYQDDHRRRDHHLSSSINQGEKIEGFRHTEQIQSKRPAWSTQSDRPRQGENIARADFDPALCCPSHRHAVAHKQRRSHTHNTRAHIPMSSKTQRTPSIFEEVIAVA